MSQLERHWDRVPQNWRHIVASMPDDKKTRLLNRANHNLIQYIDFDEVSTAVDWGCGGGLLSKELSKYTNVHMVDLCQNSLTEANLYCPEALSSIHLDPENPPELKCDLVFCTDVIQHFPSLEFFDGVCATWKSYNPKYIAIHVKLADENKECEHYETDYLNGLLVSEDYILSAFSEYELINKSQDVTATGTRIGFYVFRRR